MNTPVVSVIVPVYNSVLYFENCIKSIVDQSYKNLEIILVNDGSTDGTENIINKYAAIDNRIKVINKENQGTQYARRDGLGMATGDYIQNLDCDDMLTRNAIAGLVKKAQTTDADMIASPFYFCPVDKPRYLSSQLKFKTLSGVDYFREVCFRRAYWPTWTTFHKRELYLKNDIFIDPDILMTEDTIHTVQLCVYSRKVVSMNKPTVYYSYRDDSLSMRKKIDDVKYKDLRKYPFAIEQFLRSKGLDETLEKELQFLHIRVAFESIYKRRLDNLHQDMNNIAEILRRSPELYSELTHRENKVIKLYKMSPILGRLNIYRYMKQNKL